LFCNYTIMALSNGDDNWDTITNTGERLPELDADRVSDNKEEEEDGTGDGDLDLDIVNLRACYHCSFVLNIP
jgi:hypothetical protein